MMPYGPIQNLIFPYVFQLKNRKYEKLKIKKVVMHCFSGNKELTERATNNGWMFSVPSIVVRSKTYRKLAKRIPLNQLLTETDAPFLSPFEGKRNEPSFITESIKKIAELKKITVFVITSQLPFYVLLNQNIS